MSTTSVFLCKFESSVSPTHCAIQSTNQVFLDGLNLEVSNGAA